MTFLNQEITFDVGHLVLLLAFIALLLYVAQRYREKFEVQAVQIQPCRCQSCLDAVQQQAQSGQLYGCDASNPYIPFSPEECNYSYRKAALHGCGVAL